MHPTLTSFSSSPGHDLPQNRRILVVDDNEAIHADFRKILSSDEDEAKFDDEEAEFFGRSEPRAQRTQFELAFASQGQEALQLVQAAAAAGRRYAMVFMDVRMPPGWDGIETTLKLWEVDPDLQVVICTAYSDYSWDEMTETVGSPERLLILKKPFDTIEVLQLAHALTEKWSLLQASRSNTAVLETAVLDRNRELQASHALLELEITERKRSAEVLAESERRFREMMENIELLAVTIDKTGRVTFCNDYFLRATGWDRAEILGSDWLSLFAPGIGGVKTPFLATIETGEIPPHHESSLSTKRGELREVTWNNTLLRDAEGHVAGVASIGEDVTERRRSEERLREQAALLDIAQDAILVRDLHNFIHFWNKGAEALYGWTAEEAIGRNVMELLYTDSGRFQEARRGVIEKGAWVGELQQKTKSGLEITVECHWTLVRDEAGQPKSILAINTDLTERNLLRDQLLRAQRMESLGTLAGGIAHDLNNTLSPITMAIELLKGKLHDEGSLRILDIVETSAQRGASMVRQILSFARGAEGDHVVLQPKYLIDELQKIVGDSFPKSVECRTEISPGLSNMLGDSTQIHQVLLNLCVNARDAMPDGGRITITAANVTLDEPYAATVPEAHVGPYIAIEVRDTGTGMPPAVIEKIFDPFFTTKEFGQGTGLGLSTTIGIIKSHGGFIRVFSEVGKGTTFRMHFPADADLAVAVPETGRAEAIRGHGEWVLIVDDEAALRTVTACVLQDQGYRVLTASDGAEAVALYAQRRTDIAVVLTDMMMPVMGGAATVAVLRKINPLVRIITSSGLKTAGEGHGAPTHFLPKPYTADALLRTLAEILAEPAEPPEPLLLTFARGGELGLPVSVCVGLN